MKTTIIGLGYIGLPTSVIIANRNNRVFGIDINKNLVSEINNNKLITFEPGLKSLLNSVIKKNYFSAHTQIQKADFYLIVVPTPFNENKQPNLSFVNEALFSTIPYLKEGDTLIIESTCPVGTTDQIAKEIFQNRPELKNKIYIAYCPERVLPGNVIHELIHNDRVIGGIDKKSTFKAIDFYSKFVKVIYIQQMPALQRCVSLLKIALEMFKLHLQTNYQLFVTNPT